MKRERECERRRKDWTEEEREGGRRNGESLATNIRKE